MRVHKSWDITETHFVVQGDLKSLWGRELQLLCLRFCPTDTNSVPNPAFKAWPTSEGAKAPCFGMNKDTFILSNISLKSCRKYNTKRSGRKTSTATKPANKIISAEFCTSIGQKLNDVSQVSLQNCAYINNLFDCCKSLLIKCFLGRKTALLSKIKAIWVKSASRDLMRENTNSPLKLMSRKLKIP